MKAIISLILLISCQETPSTRNYTPSPEVERPEVSQEISFPRSQIHRIRGNEVISNEEEATSDEDTYLTIPLIGQSDDGINSDSVVRQTRPQKICGTNVDQNIAERIKDCQQKNLSSSTFIGKTNGNTGEGDWSLVSLDKFGFETWIDLTTKMLWSDTIDNTNWCKASGNNQGSVEDITISCLTIGENQNICSSQLSESLGSFTKLVKWRLPTRNDYLLADINGSRLVFEQSSESFWTATVHSLNRDQAWSINLSTGQLLPVSRDKVLSVRCIGSLK